MKTANLKTKAISILLALAMLIGMMPISVFAGESEPSYVALGDSISTGYGLEGYTAGAIPAASFGYLLAEDIGYELTNLAVDGNTAAGVLAQLQTDAVKTAVTGADLITITAGGNDLMGALYQAIADDYNTQKGTNYTGADVMKEFADGSSTDMSFGIPELGRVAQIVTGFSESEAFETALQAYKNAMLGTTGDNAAPGVIDTILDLNPDVTIILATQYNPYKVFNTASSTYAFLYEGIEAGAQKLNAAITENADSEGYIVANVYKAFADSSENLCNAESGNLDFHPNAAGHAIIADTMAAAVPIALDKPKAPVLSYDSFWFEHEATWTVGENVSGYEYELYEDAGTDPVEKDTVQLSGGDDECSIELEYVFKSGSTYKFRIKALGATGYADSEWSDYATYTYYHYDPIVVGGQLLHYGDKYEIDDDSYAVYEGENGNAVLRLANFELTANDIEDVEFLPEKGYENQSSYGGDRRAMIYTHLDNLTIVLEGTNALTCGIGNFAMIQSSGKIIVSSASNGKLTLTSDKINVRGIAADDAVTIQNCELNITTTATALSVDDIDFINCEATLLTASETGTVIPFNYSYSTDVTLSGCIAVAGADKDNTEVFERVKSTYKYMKVFVPEAVLDAPEDLKMNNVTASWTAVANATGYEAELYVKEVGDDEFVIDARSSNLITGTSYTFYSVISAGEQYYFRVRALGNGETIGSSEWATSEVYERGDFFIGDIDLKDKQYLYNDGTLSTSAPADSAMGYAYYEKGETDTLTMSNFSFSGLSEENYDAVIYGTRSLDVKLIGDNSLTATEYSDSTGFIFEMWPDPSASQPSFADRTLKITGEADSTLTVDAECLADGYSAPYITVGAGVTVTSTGYVCASELTVNGSLYAENDGLILYGKLIRGEQGYISAAVEEDAGYGAIEFDYGPDAPASLTETDFLTLNGGEAVGGDGKATTLGYYLYSYEYGSDTYNEYFVTFYDPSIPAADQTDDNALKKVIICSKGAVEPPTPTVTVDAVCDRFWGTVTGSGSYEEGAAVTLTATPTDSTQFEYWLDTSVELGDEPTEAELKAAIKSYDATYTFTATKNISLEAVFSLSEKIRVTPMLIAGTDEKSLLDADDLEYDAGTINPGAEQIALPGEVIEKIITIGDKQYRFAGFLFYSYDEATETDTVELKETFTVGAMPLYGSAEYWNWLASISDGLFAAYLPYTPETPNPETPNPENPAPETPAPETPDPANPEPENPDPENPVPGTPEPVNPDPENPVPANPDPVNPDDPQEPIDPETPADAQNPNSPQTGDNSHMALWIALLFISGGAAITLADSDKKRNTAGSK